MFWLKTDTKTDTESDTETTIETDTENDTENDTFWLPTLSMQPNHQMASQSPDHCLQEQDLKKKIPFNV